MSRLQLTDREKEVLRLAIKGLSNDEIAASLAISRRTVEAHMRTLFRKTGVTRRAQLAALSRSGDGRVGPAPLLALDGADGPGQPWADHERQLHRHAEAVRGLIDRQFLLFEERVEITLVVGDRDGQDLVVERRCTAPRPYLVYRILGPILSWSAGSPFDLDDLGLTCNVYGQDVHVDTHEVRDVNGRPLVMVLFQPGLHTDTEWELRYRSPGLWTPLRDTGQDSLTWATATFDQRHPATTSDLTLKVIFPASWTAERLTEQSDLGSVQTERLSTGQAQLTWHHDAPHLGAYRWLLEGSPTGS
ncbi:MAG TPA: helix-turn-helix transcriptional regulator [Pseudonocardiaceae bacterium]|nr:helix-turn-helix transcriptional regulator [Pseudonocardiaceae bacterium]